MILAGVSINELAEYLGNTEQETVELLNIELGIMQNYKVMLAVTEIVRGKERT